MLEAMAVTLIADPEQSQSTQCPLRAGDCLGPDIADSIRRKMSIDHFKWDPQVGDVSHDRAVSAAAS